MTALPTCPRCRTELTADAGEPDLFRCSSCNGVFVPANRPPNLPETDTATTIHSANSKPAATNDETESEMLLCPLCALPMSVLRMAEAMLRQCDSCGGSWMDAAEEKDGESSSPVAQLRQSLLYSLTLPERVVRSTVGASAGAVKEAAEFLIPSAFQNSKTYEVVVKNSLRFLTEDVGGVAIAKDEAVLGNDFAARKAVGNFIDLAGWATLAVSPVWIMAIVSDVAYGSKSYVRELATEMQKKGLIDENSTIHSVDDVLSAVQNAAGGAASLVDTPPLSVEQLKESLKETREAIKAADIRKVLPEAELKNYWQEMRDIAQRENVSLVGVSGTLTLHTLDKMGTLSRGALTGVQVAGGLFRHNIIDHYVDSLKAVREKGFYQTIRMSSEPYIQAVWNNFSSEKSTWTQELVTGRAFGRAFNAVKGLLSRSKKTDGCENTGTAEPPT